VKSIVLGQVRLQVDHPDRTAAHSLGAVLGSEVALHGVGSALVGLTATDLVHPGALRQGSPSGHTLIDQEMVVLVTVGHGVTAW
jgi:hypothetical protein